MGINMPSWDVHEAVSRDVFGISEDVAHRINKIVDAGSAHDVGRKMPREPTLLSRFRDPEGAEAQMRRLYDAQRKVRGIALCGSEWARAFWLHHILDFLSYRLIAAYTVGANLEKYGNNILKGVSSEFDSSRLDPLRCNGYIKTSLEEFKAKFNDVVSHPRLRGWAMGAADERRKVWSAMSAQSYLDPYIQHFLKKGNVGDMANPEYLADPFDMRKAIAAEKGFMDLMYRVSYYAAARSFLIDYALLLPYPWELISEVTLRVTKNRSAFLGRHALEVCDIFEGYEERRTRIIGEVHDYERIYLLRHGVSPPQQCAAEYAASFISGYETVTSRVQDTSLH